MASGRGSNAKALITYCQSSEKFEVGCLICDQKDAAVTQKASSQGVPSYTISRENTSLKSLSEKRVLHEEKILEVLSRHKVDFVCLAGYMKVLSPYFLKEAQKRKMKVVNIHPSLLPEFPGLNAYERAFREGKERSGVTVHFVDEGVDTGKIILQRSFERHPTDGLTDFIKRGLEVEHKLYPMALEKITELS